MRFLVRVRVNGLVLEPWVPRGFRPLGDPPRPGPSPGPKEYEFPGPKEYEFPGPKQYEFPGPKEYEF